ncbi:MAG: LEA type 2 family protein [Chromatiales bacterium]|nr:LEA type 2 family protein [Chromatiales bacterium]
MKILVRELLTAFFLLFFTINAGCAALQAGNLESPRVRVVDLRVLDVKLLEQRYALTLRIQNPNNQGLDIAGLDFTLSINGEEFADGVSSQEITLPAYGEATMDVEVSSSLMRILDQIQALDQRREIGLSYRIEGHVGLESGWRRLPFSREGTLGEKDKPAVTPRPI